MAYDVRNRKTIKNLKESEGAELEIRKSAKGNIFFVCGTIVGGCSDKVKAVHETVTPDQLEYAEVSRDGGEYVPVLMMRNTSNVVRKL
jgi:hypothetical protein